MKERYIDLMEKALSAYTDEHIRKYFEEVRENGLTEHGFPRLVANIGILIAHGRRVDLLPLFAEMMSVCCKMFLRPYVKAANEFSVREVLCCIAELEAAGGIVDADTIAAWKRDLAAIEPDKCYNSHAKSLLGQTRNWAVFMTVSELFRQWAGLRDDATDFIDLHLGHQMQWFDENGMYRDNKHATVHQPIMYDLVTRGLCSLLLQFGYRGRYYEQIDRHLKHAAWMSLQMQSPTGEIAFGGRSNQFLLCEGWQAQVFEYEASRYAALGDRKTASIFKRAAHRSVEACERWISRSPISHVKNRFPTETRFGCEKYGYFDKYMITVASNFYVAYLMCNEDVPAAEEVARPPYTLMTGEHFHKLFLGCGEYQLEFDLNADPEYDANGLGRIQRAGAPSTICLSVPCPAKPNYAVDTEQPTANSLCSAVRESEEWTLGAEFEAEYEVLGHEAEEDCARATLLCRFANGKAIKEHYAVDEGGVAITLAGEGEIGFVLPAFCFDGEISPKITVGEHSLTVSYDGWVCQYSTDGEIVDLQRIAANRNGHYRAYLATAHDVLHVSIEIRKL